MDFTKLPTDNFYIFICFGGLGLIIYFISLFIKTSNGINNSILTTEISLLQNKSESTISKKECDYITKKIKLYSYRFEKMFGITFNFSEEQNIENLSIPEIIIKDGKVDLYIEEYLKIEDLYLLLYKEIKRTNITLDLLEHETKTIRKKFNDLNKSKNLTTFAIVLGLFLFIVGLFAWYFRYQIYQDRLQIINYETAIKNLESDTLTKKPDILNKAILDTLIH